MEQQRIGKIMHIGQLLPEQLQEPVRFDDVELTEEEMKLAIEEAKEKKWVRLEDERKQKLAAMMHAELTRTWNAQELYNFVRQRGDRILSERSGRNSIFQPTESQIPVVEALSLYFAEDEKFEELNASRFNSTGIPFSLQKGIWLWGNPGTGKTLIMQMFSRNKRQCYRMLECSKIVRSFAVDGYEAISQYTKVWSEPPGADNFFQTQMGICYNDLGTEHPTAKSYGNEVNVMEYIFLQTYENHVPHAQRHVITNLTFDQVEQTYGVRFKDRIRECFNVIELQGSSLRR